MGAFPSRLLRDELGPTLENNYPVENPKTDIGAETWNQLFWQATGAALIVSRATLIAVWGGAAFTISYQAEAWNPRNGQARPVLARTSAGVYTYQFLSSYLNHDGFAVATELFAARVSVHKVLAAFADRVVGYAWKDGTDPLKIQIRLWKEADGTAVDEPFWLEVL